MARIKQCIKCEQVKPPKSFDIVNGKRNDICIECNVAEEDVVEFDDNYEFTEEDFTDDQAESKE